jgi:hypothetical protein
MASMKNLASVIAATLLPTTVPAAAGVPVAVGAITARQSCTTYVTGAGSSAMVATADGFAVADSWRTWLVRDCEQQFTMLRGSLEAALAGTGYFAIGTRRGGYRVTGSISDVGVRATPDGSTLAIVMMELHVADGVGHLVYGGLLTKAVDLPGGDASMVYNHLEQQVALAAARLVAFRLTPLTVLADDGRDIRLNYGAPLLETGTMLSVMTAGGFAARFVVASADGASATAEPDGDTGRVMPGSIVTVIEPEASAANARRLRRGTLP